MTSTEVPTTRSLAAAQQSDRRPAAGTAQLSVSLPPTTGPEDAAVLVQWLVDRHELLRSRLVPAPGHGGLAQETFEGAKVRWEPAGGRAREGTLVGTVGGLPLQVELRPAARDGSPRLVLSLPARAVDLGGLAALGRDLLAPVADDDAPEPVQPSQYAAWHADTRASARRAGSAPGGLPASGRAAIPAAPLLGGAPGVERPTGPSATGYGRVAVDLDEVEWDTVTRLAHHLGVTAEELVLGLWVAVLWRANGHREATCGVYVDLRRRYPDLAEMAGVASHHLPLVVEPSEDDTVADVVARAAARWRDLVDVAEAFAWDDVAPGEVACDPRSPQAPVLFASVPVVDAVLDDADLAEPSHDPRLALHLLHTGSRGRLELHHRQDLVDRQAAATLVEAVTAALRDLSTRPQRPLLELGLLSPTAATTVLERLGRAPERVELDRDHPCDLFAEQVARTPDRLAVTDGERSLTYAELDARAADVAAALVAAGLSRGDRVVLLLDRGVDTVAAVWGAWRAGLAYVPIDLSTPAERIGLILDDSGAGAVLTEAALRDRLPGTEVPVLVLEDIAWGEVPAPADRAHRGDAEDLAYVIYTSGTTGRPKGVMVEHRSALNLARAHRARIYRHHDADRSGMRVSLNAALAFDGAVERLLLLLSGCSLFISDEEARRDPRRFLDYARQHRLDVLDLTPTFLTLLVQHGLLDDPSYQPSVVLVGGEAIGPALWAQLAASDIAFYNVYGPTETTVNAAVGLVDGDEPHLGWALPNVRIHVLDPGLRPVPIGVPGEVHVAGAGLARGYLGRPELTAERFIGNPHAPGHARFGRLYRTGDLARFRPDGTLEFLGRTDTQIKVRGFRVETAEVAGALCTEPAVTDALVRLLDDPGGGAASLVAYVVAPAEAHDGLAERLRARLVSQLPDYMVPRDIVAVTGFPLTANGKVDVAALPAPSGERALSTPFVAPEGELEAAVAAVWEDVLGVAGIGRHDNFFELGGDSLLAVAMVVRLNEDLGVELALAAVFTDPTVAGLAVAVTEEQLEDDLLDGEEW
jgi:amino acid adenylation domain-containing protein